LDEDRITRRERDNRLRQIKNRGRTHRRESLPKLEVRHPTRAVDNRHRRRRGIPLTPRGHVDRRDDPTREHRDRRRPGAAAARELHDRGDVILAARQDNASPDPALDWVLFDGRNGLKIGEEHPNAMEIEGYTLAGEVDAARILGRREVD